MNNNEDIITLITGDLIQHNKTKGEYEIMGFIDLNLYGKHDTQEVYIYSDKSNFNHTWSIWEKRPAQVANFLFPVMLQFDNPQTNPYDAVSMVLYRSVYPKDRQPWMFLRPYIEFTPNRFTVLNRAIELQF